MIESYNLILAIRKDRHLPTFIPTHFVGSRVTRRFAECKEIQMSTFFERLAMVFRFRETQVLPRDTRVPLCTSPIGVTNRKMFKTINIAVKTALFTLLLAVGVSAQTTSGTVNLSGAVSKFVEINSGGAVTLSGNSGGGVTTDGTANNPLAVVVDLGELGPSNTASFVTANVPLKLRSNAAYVMSLAATVSSTGTTANRITAADVGFGLGTVSRSGTGVNTAGSDTNATSGDPTLVANGSVNGTSGRYEYTATLSNLGAFSSATTALSGAFILNAVPRSNNNGLTVPAMFAVKPQFYEVGTTTVTATFTVTAP